MKFKKLLAYSTVICMLIVCSFSMFVHASDVSLVDGNSVLFGGIEVKVGNDDKVVMDPDWIGIASDIDVESLILRLGAAVDLDLDEEGNKVNYTLSLGANWVKLYSLVAMVETTGVFSIQNAGDGLKLSAVGNVLASTARVGFNVDFGCLPLKFDTYPLVLIGREYSVIPGVSDPSGIWWLSIDAMLQSYSTRNDKITLGYRDDMESSAWRGDLGYTMEYSPDGLGIAVQLYTGLAIGAPEITLCNELTLKADITMNSGLESTLVAQNGEGGNFIWASGGGWLDLMNKCKMSIKMSAPVYGHNKAFDGNQLFKPVSSAEIIGSIEFKDSFLSGVNAKYSFNENRLRIGISAKF